MIKLGQANRIIAEIFARGREIGCRPMSVIVVEPGFVDTELQGHNRDDVREVLEARREEIGDVLVPEDIADGILYAVSRAPHVSVNEVLIRPTRQLR